MSEDLQRDQNALPEFELLECLGTSQAETWHARSHASGEDVIVKIYRFEQATDWKGLDLFRREITALKQLKHPGIPRYLAHRELELDGQLHVYLVQEHVIGKSLEKLAKITAEELRNLARGVLEILAYLQSFSPPIIHRDIKPANIMVEENGKVHLVDFGAVQLVTPADEGGSTIVGTSGYMPFEQLMGRASPASDLFGLGMTLVWLITRVHPDTLPVVDMRVIWEERKVIPVPDDFKRFVDRLIEPVAEDRYPDAVEALRALDAGVSRGLAVRRPKDMQIEVIQSTRDLRLLTPPRNPVFFGFMVGFPLLPMVFFARILPASGALFLGALLLMASGYMIYLEIRRPVEIRILPNQWQLRGRYHVVASGPNDQLVGIGRVVGDQDKRLMNVVTRDATFQMLANISEDEERWLNASIRAFVAPR